MAGIASSITNAIYNGGSFNSSEMELLVDIINNTHDDDLFSFANDDVEQAMKTYSSLLANSSGRASVGGNDLEMGLLSNRTNLVMSTPDNKDFFNKYKSGNSDWWNPLKVRDVYNKSARDYLWEILAPIGTFLTSGSTIAAIMREVSVRVALYSAGSTSAFVSLLLILRSRNKDDQLKNNKDLMSSFKSLAKAKIELNKSYLKMVSKLRNDLGPHVKDDKKQDTIANLNSDLGLWNASPNMRSFVNGGFLNISGDANPEIKIEGNDWFIKFDDSMTFSKNDVEILERLS
ncbi:MULTISPECIES: hypothetical protein [Erwiniaceae]|uniref:Uncharacterized protein n=1 Tax=Pantoea rwandensis TaxID=1076550 RepID=A0ABM5RIH5_9GAMM|nr:MULTISPECIES: hypothetical protein [Erwiniaceae]AIR85816.1 hypothetical protein LH22_10205 [Pantoea rwandensis]MBK0091563.1 hypothetical protein [Erwinia sp. S59]MBK0124826.1 hypothetical protein [Pantoea sp. S61]